MSTYIAAITELANQLDAVTDQTRKFEIMSKISAQLDAVIFAVRQATK